ncbi:hypothetical protein C8F04DRAFT_1278070 [Mycena alexandri]|uniref:Uncharacterized protein n=1 Tax=Mycena alexandri TaxID=1745969 RepID=A0AAD6S1F1_9AGAR|nr:hypothetical protein C8F04DRAFT_1278070 [Mycena alexandri]
MTLIAPFRWAPQIDGVCGGPGVPSSDDKIKPQFPFAATMFCVERPVDDTTFNLPTPTMPFPYKHLIDYCTTQQRNALRYDMNFVDDDDPNHKFFLTWSEMQAEKKWHPASDTPCSMCGLFVALFGFGCYFKNTIEPELGSHIICHICKACFRFSDSNPRFDWETMTTTAPPCSCPPGFLACGDAYTDCALHANVPVITPAPAGCVEGRGPLLRSEARETMYQLVFNLHDACDKAKWGTEAKRLANERLAAFNIHYDNFQSDPKWVFPETLAQLFVKPPAKSALNVPSTAKGQTSNAKGVSSPRALAFFTHLDFIFSALTLCSLVKLPAKSGEIKH